MRKVIWARSAGFIIAATLTAVSLSGSAHAAETGSISGTFTDRSGAPMSGVAVYADPAAPGAGDAYTTTDASGHYIFASLPSGEYRLQFRPMEYASQYAPQKDSFNDAQLYPVLAGSATQVNEQLMPFGTITGRLTNINGTGLAGTQVSFSSTTYSYLYATTDANGYYTVHPHVGSYRVSFPLPTPTNPPGYGEYLLQYVPGTDSWYAAQLFAVAANQTVTVNDTVMPNGYITGKFSAIGGAGMPNIYVTALSSPTSSGGYNPTDANGNFKMRVKAGSYKVHFSNHGSGVYQYAYGKVHIEDADQISVANGETAVVNDTKLATGSVRITAKDAVSGEPINYFWGWLEPGVGVSDPDDRDGAAVLSEVPAGTYTAVVQAVGYVTNENGGQVTVVVGQQSDIEVTLQRRTRIDATVVDAVTGQPIAGVCLVPGQLDQFNTPDGCSEHETGRDGKGTIEIYNDEPGEYQLMAFPSGSAAKGYGAQWVGPAGGVGSQLEAKNLTVVAGQATNAGIIKMDKAGTISGHLTRSSGSGQVQWGTITMADWGFRIGGGLGLASSDDQGNYKMDFLGPYAWPLRFSAADEAMQWSGGKGNRHEAHRIQVTTGNTTTYNYPFRAGTTVQISARTTGEDGCDLDAYNAATGDLIGYAGSENCRNGLTLNVLDGQSIKLWLHYSLGPNNHFNVWHGGTNFANATAVNVTGPMSFPFSPGERAIPLIEPAPPAPPTPRPTETLGS